MFFESISDDERKCFLRQNYEAFLPGYTGHCPTLKFRFGKGFGACTKDIMKELLEKKILKTGPYRPNSAKENATFLCQENEKPAWRSDTHSFKAIPPYIMGYTGYIPGFNSSYGLPFMRAVEEGAKDWRENQSKLKARQDFTRNNAERNDISKHLLRRIKADNVVETENHLNHDKSQGSTFYYEISPERPPIVGYTGHIPGAKGEVALSKRYAQAAKKGLESMRNERERRI